MPAEININTPAAILHATREKETPGKEKIRYTNPLNKTGNIKIPGNQHKDIVEGLVRKNKTQVTETMHQHVKNQAVAVKAMIQEQE